MLYLKVLVQTLAFGLTITTMVLELSDKRSKKAQRARRILYVCTVLSLLVGIYATIKDDRQTNKREADLKAQLTTMQAQNDGLRQGIAIVSDKSTSIIDEQRTKFITIVNEQRRLGLDTAQNIEDATNVLHSGIADSIRKQKELLTQQRLTLGNLTGEGSYCYLVPIPVGENTMLFKALFVGKFPLYDVSMEMTDPTAFEVGMEGLEGRELVEFDKNNRKRFQVGTLPGGRTYLDTIDVTGVNERDYNILISSRFLNLQERLFLNKINTRWRFAFILRNANTGEVLGKYIEYGFPADKITKVTF